MFVRPNIVVPLPISQFAKTGQTSSDGAHWITDGRKWHLDKRCSKETKQLLLAIDSIIQEHLQVDPKWSQQRYVAYRKGNFNWLVVSTRKKDLLLDFYHRAGAFDGHAVAERLGVTEVTEIQEEDMPSSSSVRIRRRRKSTDRLSLWLKPGFDTQSTKFVGFLQEAYDASR
jgi:hypothetical protein